MKSPLVGETANRATVGDSKWKRKALARLFATAIASVAMIIFSATIAKTNENFVTESSGGYWTDGLPLAPIVLSMLYNPVAIIILLIVRKGRHFHPAFNIIGDFLIWGLLVPSIVFTSAGGIFWNWAPAIPTQDGTVDCGFYFNQWSRECVPVAYTIGHMEIAGIVFLFLLFVIHFTLFASACSVARKWRKNPQSNQFEKGEFEMQYSKDLEQQSTRS